MKLKRSYMKRGTSELKRVRLVRRRRAVLRNSQIKIKVNEDKNLGIPSTEKLAAPKRRRSGLKAGPRMKEWARVWAWLKPRLEAAGRTGCEFDFLEHDCGGPLDPAHSKKRFKMQAMDIYTVALACRTIHDYLDGLYVYPPLGRRVDHGEMELLVKTAIARHGGVILPEKKAA